MPLYEYQCDACGNRFERIQKFSDALVSECPECGSPVRKLISSPAIQFKGSGFYITDYAKSGSSESEKADKAEKAKSDSKSAGGESKAPESDHAPKADKAASTPSTTTSSPSSSDSGTGAASTTPSAKGPSNPPTK